MRISLTLENNGSVARDHLAAERTFLAYVRTSLALATTGVALVQLFSIAMTSNSTFSPISGAVGLYARPLGATTVLLALIFLVVGVTGYFSIQGKLTQGVFPVARIFIVGLTTILAALIAIVFGVVLGKK